MDYLKMANAEKSYVTEMYRAFHKIPEKSRFEIKTNRLIREELDKMGAFYHAPAENITIAVIEGKNPGPVVGIRADTDALPLTEETDLSYKSEIDGMMHACGHDGHIAAALTCAKILTENKEKLNGTVKIIFQPAEEGEMGAQAVIETGLVNDVNAFFSVHLWSPYQTGEMRVAPRGVAASTDMFTVNIHGRAGHGAMPEVCIDAVVCVSALVMNLQSIVSRFTSPFSPVVVTVGSVRAGARCNIIAGEATLEGTIRTFDPKVYDEVHEHFDRIVKDTCDAYRCTYEIKNVAACGVTWNDEKLCEIALENAKKIAPAGEVGLDTPFTLGDDFGEYRSIAPICYMKVGIKNEKIDAVYAHHHPKFKVDEDALPRAVAWLLMNAQSVLNEQ
ncbi:MAG: amidohydrolase [Clostridia bacterium]|nr:amidohydrolase [Clostridia bacterium]